MKRAVAIGAALAAMAAAAAFGGYRYAMHRMMSMETAAPAAAPGTAERKVLYWHDPMFPQHKFDKPGRSPFMDMQLVPVYGDQGTGAGPGISVSAGTVQNLGVRTVDAALGSLEPKMEAVGSVGWNERNVVLVQTRSAGFVEKLHARAPLDAVAKGAPLVEILFPEWAAAQEEFLLLRQRMPELAQAARRRLALLGMSEAQIGEVERASTVQPRFTLRAPVSGVIAELAVREGMTVAAGALLFRIVDLSTVWVTAEVPESQAGWLKPGASVEARVPAWPETVFKGTLSDVLPEINATTRTVRARVELANPGTRLKPGMFANLSLSGGRGKEVVLVPSEAVIRTGERNVVIVADGKRFVPADVQVGQEMSGRTEILRGLKPGDKVVVSGQFLIDSEASLKGALARLEGPAAAPAVGATHKGRGTVTDIDPAKGTLELDHEPIASMKWPRMKMGFGVADKAALGKLKKGDVVEFEMRGDPDKDGNYTIEKLQPRGGK